jgi:hypothetical protein
MSRLFECVYIFQKVAVAPYSYRRYVVSTGTDGYLPTYKSWGGIYRQYCLLIADYAIATQSQIGGNGVRLLLVAVLPCYSCSLPLLQLVSFSTCLLLRLNLLVTPIKNPAPLSQPNPLHSPKE